MDSRAELGNNGLLHAVADDALGTVDGDVCDDIVIYTQAWNADHAAKPGEKPNAQLHGRVFVNGHEIRNASGVTVKAGLGDFLTAQIEVFPGTLKIKALDAEEWKNLG